MKVPVSWLRDYVAFDLPLPELAERLVLSGLEVDRIITRGAPDLDGNHGHFKIGRVVEFGKHPNADRLRLCRVDVGEGEPRQIVCGASNFVTGDTVVVALPGAVLPGAPEPLRQAKLRGEVSDGMMLSERELQLSDEHDGIIRLPDVYEIGSDAADHFALAGDRARHRGDREPRRPDVRVRHRPRDLDAARHRASRRCRGWRRRPPPARPTSDVVRVGIDDVERCLRFTARAFEGVTVAASPLLIRQRVAACRHAADLERRRHHELRHARHRHPTHAYDATKIPGDELTARLARPGETIDTLDGKPRTLTGRHAGDRRCRPARTASPGSWAARARRSRPRPRRSCSRRRTSSATASPAPARRSGCAPTAPAAGSAASTRTCRRRRRRGRPSCWSSWPAGRC